MRSCRALVRPIEVGAGPSKGRMKICSEYVKEGYYEEFMAKLEEIVYGDKDIKINFINRIRNQMR
jgi:hypothetical protein